MSRILIVEDDAIIAFDLAEQLADAGFTIVGPALTSKDGLRALSETGCDAAILDVNLGSETSEAVAHELIRRNIPFLTVSGYSYDQFPAVFRLARPMAKPMRVASVIAELRRLTAG
ncbi:MAG: hypothetical protein NW223_03660 [Hyphomicrobiaceae bacterium]|nr:hypothetical protein [Hyphomicrobiaceae bacterium]